MPSRFDGALDIAGDIIAAIARIFWPRTFLAFKVRVFTLFTAILAGKAALSLDVGFKQSDGVTNFIARLGGIDTVSIVTAALTLASLLLANLLMATQRRHFDRELLELARDPNVPKEVKERVIAFLLDERMKPY